jgi:hypothetical protein
LNASPDHRLVVEALAPITKILHQPIPLIN